jgi:hypothetical protein
MNLNRNRVLAGLAGTGIVVGVLAGGGTAFASTAPAHAPSVTAATPTPSPSPSPTKCAWGHHHGKMKGNNAIGKAVATYLGVSQDQLRTQLESGKSLADVAKAHKKSVSGLETTILAAATKQINASSMTPAEKAAEIGDVKSHLPDIVNTTWKKCPMHPTASPMPTHTMSVTHRL